MTAARAGAVPAGIWVILAYTPAGGRTVYWTGSDRLEGGDRLAVLRQRIARGDEPCLRDCELRPVVYGPAEEG